MIDSTRHHNWIFFLWYENLLYILLTHKSHCLLILIIISKRKFKFIPLHLMSLNELNFTLEVKFENFFDFFDFFLLFFHFIEISVDDFSDKSFIFNFSPLILNFIFLICEYFFYWNEFLILILFLNFDCVWVSFDFFPKKFLKIFFFFRGVELNKGERLIFLFLHCSYLKWLWLSLYEII